MKKIFLSIVLALVLVPSFVFAATKYEVPVKLEKFGEPGKESMGNASIRPTAEVTEKDGKYSYKLYAKKMEFMNMEGELIKLFIYDKDKDSSRVETKQSPVTGEYNKTHEFERTNPKEDKILVAVWVDAMDAIAGGGPGSGEQKAYLVFDWANAKGVETKDAEVEKAATSSEIKIVVSGKEIKPETLAYIENGRTMVPLRFISEALGEKVDWKADTNTVIIGDNKATLKIGSNEISAAGKKITIDSPAVIKNSRTFVPLRAISEILGAKVEWDGATRTVSITK
ncbi:Iron Transport-associated domain-containing protein [Peptoniphilus asaccharolyticus DSM 20463]|uniref:Iron Transport-associated domain-containing protein n=1 Tax=Peptoniphilus asaccharolyticus DSM 20463 TaxID=573058 RepID=A0A1W1UG35_PEPAS|nr:copper amine oxidase N-terminal domain-containing protein [Peptoniphilus asaccharolyticus]MBL7574667.1 copper amine oxidase N-terminal domain-containing protein [Peptoniphilus asaccharolyticus]SMB79993.1 Iron Transport-associated domain-containing protein [Peptoniphilus asaccharolyticus DSM 20463]